ncbi:MAG: hypothetical protein K2X50_07500 [Gammaproteobacteria bacterium]|nr:hypothetical protein [Gammaproteobacteria bacterium]
MSRVKFKETTKTSENETKLAIICECFTTTINDTLGTLKTRPKLQEKDFLLETWTRRQLEGHLRNVLNQQIQSICILVNSRINQNIDSNHPLHLMLFEYLHWLALKLSGATRTEESIASVNKRIEYINALMKSALLSGEDANDQEIRMLLNNLKKYLRKIIPKLKPETPTTQLHSHLESLVTHGKFIIDNGIRFLHTLFSNTELHLFPGVAKLQANDPFIAVITNTKSGQLLKALLIAPQLSELFKEKETSSPTTSPRSPRLTVGLHRKNSLKQIQINNPFITSDNRLCIPRALLNGSNQAQTSLIEFFHCEELAQECAGIHSPFLNKPNIIGTFVKMHALLYETTRVLHSCKEAMDLAEEDFKLLDFHVCNTLIIGLMKKLNDLHGALQTCKLKLIDCTTQTWEILSKAGATTDPNTTLWIKNIASISNITSEFDSAWKRCCEETKEISAIATTIPIEGRKKTTAQKVVQYEQAVELLNQEIDTFLTNLPKSPETSPQSSPRGTGPKSPTTSRQSSPTLSKNTSAQTKSTKNRFQEITDSVAARRGDRKTKIKPSTFVIPEPGVTPVVAYSPTPSRDLRPPPPQQSPALLPRPESPPQIPQFALGSPVVERRRTASSTSVTLVAQEQIGIQSLTLVQATHSPSPERKLTSAQIHSISETNDDSAQRTSQSPESEKLKVAHCLSLFGIKKVLDQDIPELLRQIRPDTERIDLNLKQITGTVLVPLCESLIKHKSIRQINLSCNPTLFNEISSSKSPNSHPYPAALALKELLEATTSLKDLWLSDCRPLSTTCAGLIANGLRDNQSLEFLDIGDNNLSDEGAIMIFEAIYRHPTFRYLAIDGNQLTEEAGKELLNLVKSNTKITYVKFDGNKISDSLAEEIKAQAYANLLAQESSLKMNVTN